MQKTYNILLLLIISLGQVIPQSQVSILEMKNKARLYANAGYYVDAISEYERMLFSQEEILGKNHIEIAGTYNHLGELYVLVGDLTIADMYFQDALRIYELNVIQTQSKLVSPLRNLLEIYSLTGDSANQQIITDRINHISLLDSLFNSGEALSVWSPSLQQQPSFVDSTSLVSVYTVEDEAIDLIDLGFSYLDRGLFSESIESFSRGIQLHTQNVDLEFLTSLNFGDSVRVENILSTIESRMIVDSTNYTSDFIAALIFIDSDSVKFTQHIESYLQFDPTDTRAMMLLANSYYEDSNWIDASMMYLKVLLLENNIDAQFGKAMCLKHLGYFEDAIVTFLMVLEQDPYFYEAFYQSGLSYMNLEKYDLAIPQLTQSLLLNPENTNIYYDLGVSYVRTDKIRQALEAFNRTVSLNSEHGQAYYELGLIHEILLNLDKAIESYTLSRKYSPEISDVHLRLGMLLFNNDQKKEAMDPLREFVINNPDSLHVVEVLGDVFMSQNRYPEAIDAFTRLKEIYPENVLYYTAIAESHWQLKEFSEAKLAYKAILEFDDENTEVMYRLGVISNELGEFDEAVNYILSAIDCGTPTMSMFYQLALAYGSMQNYMQAIISFQDALALAPNDAEIHYQLGVAYQAMEIHTLAINEFNIYLNQFPEDETAYFLMGQSQFELEDYYQAHISFSAVSDLNKDDYRSLYFIGLCQSQLGDEWEAAKSFKKALKINPDDALSHFELAKSYLQLNKKREAKKKLNILYILDRDLHDSLKYFINL